jgi:hypothetical protein
MLGKFIELLLALSLLSTSVKCNQKLPILIWHSAGDSDLVPSNSTADKHPTLQVNLAVAMK